ncbi:hypothetical protein H1R16_11775 [Marnyiella aurantia]|uniref:Uncharacterized protein n=1 Tax=Marnyiella aurantia TaxID=2758037 RepID=A0A7D7QEL8_9FLAO|nr:hypothetical protein [Marnyiella aurantia]MBA5246264.1 hypothetical protein [Marnyiella aurantia]QMS98361.1 hypothetical protein H1R16_11775 [Marnyiella aurantia]
MEKYEVQKVCLCGWRSRKSKENRGNEKGKSEAVSIPKIGSYVTFLPQLFYNFNGIGDPSAKDSRLGSLPVYVYFFCAIGETPSSFFRIGQDEGRVYKRNKECKTKFT